MPGEHDDQRLLLADVGRKAPRQVESLVVGKAPPATHGHAAQVELDITKTLQYRGSVAVSKGPLTSF
jgi:hypothetical protein